MLVSQKEGRSIRSGVVRTAPHCSAESRAGDPVSERDVVKSNRLLTPFSPPERLHGDRAAEHATVADRFVHQISGILADVPSARGG